MGWSPFRKTGLTFHNAAASVKGYTIVTPASQNASYLIDMAGRVVHAWRYSWLRGFYGRLLENGNLILLGTDSSVPVPQIPEGTVPPFEVNVRRLGGNATHIVEMDWDGNVVWQYENHSIHHDFVRLPNGNTLVNEWVQMPEDVASSVRGGYRERNLPPMLSDDFVEVDAAGKEVRRVSLWKLLDPVRDPICPLERRLEWTHTNSLDVNADGETLFSCRTNSRIGIITADGKLRWKYGFPDISHQHHATFLSNGNVQVFDNGMHRRGMPRSSIVEVDPKDSKMVWQYTADPDIQFLSAHISGADRLAGGNVLVCEGATGRLFEVTAKKEIVWEWTSPFSHRGPQGNLMNWVFRAYRYSPEHPALTGRELDWRAHAATNRMYGLADL
jgi:outer membrane protein assembly factor BamB